MRCIIIISANKEETKAFLASRSRLPSEVVSGREVVGTPSSGQVKQGGRKEQLWLKGPGRIELVDVRMKEPMDPFRLEFGGIHREYGGLFQLPTLKRAGCKFTEQMFDTKA